MQQAAAQMVLTPRSLALPARREEAVDLRTQLTLNGMAQQVDLAAVRLSLPELAL